MVVAPQETAVHALVCEVAVDRVTVARVGLGGLVLDEREEGVDERSHAFPDVLERVVRLAAAVRASEPAGAVCVGVGAAVPGIVRAPDGLVRFAPNLGWVDAPLGAGLAERLGLGLPVVVGNDADLGALAEHLRGSAVGCTDVVYLCGQVGLGGGISTGGRPLDGADGYGGEVGHWVVNPEGRLCRCGSRGCWETEVNEHALVGSSGATGPAGVEQVARDAEAGDPRAVARLREVGRWLAIGVAGLVNVLPQVVVFGGHLATVLPSVRQQVEERLASAALTPHREAVRLAVPALGQRSALLGAAELAFAALLDDPVGHLARRVSGS